MSENTPTNKPKIGVYVCHCGSNIAGMVDVEAVRDWAQEQLGEDGVVVSRDYKFMCSSLGQELIEKDIKELGLERVVVAACSPHLHEKTFRTASERAGLNPYLTELVSIREQVSWVHTDKTVATEKSKALLAGTVHRVAYNTELEPLKVPSIPIRWWWAAASRAFRPRSKSPTPGSTFTWWSANRPLADTWRNSTRLSQPSTVQPAS